LLEDPNLEELFTSRFLKKGVPKVEAYSEIKPAYEDLEDEGVTETYSKLSPNSQLG